MRQTPGARTGWANSDAARRCARRPRPWRAPAARSRRRTGGPWGVQTLSADRFWVRVLLLLVAVPFFFLLIFCSAGIPSSTFRPVLHTRGGVGVARGGRVVQAPSDCGRLAAGGPLCGPLSGRCVPRKLGYTCRPHGRRTRYHRGDGGAVGVGAGHRATAAP